MADRYLLDTDTVIFIRSRRSEKVRARFGALGGGLAAMSVITYGELRFGADRSPVRDRDLRLLASLIEIIPVRPLEPAAAVEYAAIRADLAGRGELIGPNDLWIAAQARAGRFTLVTGHEREFRRVPGLSVENWAADA